MGLVTVQLTQLVAHHCIGDTFTSGRRPIALTEARPIALTEARPIALTEARPIGLTEARPIGLHRLKKFDCLPVKPF